MQCCNPNADCADVLDFPEIICKSIKLNNSDFFFIEYNTLIWAVSETPKDRLLKFSQNYLQITQINQISFPWNAD